jgi:hypothetical protein
MRFYAVFAHSHPFTLSAHTTPHIPPISLPSTTYLPPSHSQQFYIFLRPHNPYPALGLPLRANRIPAPFSPLSQQINIVLFYDSNVTLLPQNTLFPLNSIQNHRIIVQFQAI